MNDKTLTTIRSMDTSALRISRDQMIAVISQNTNDTSLFEMIRLISVELNTRGEKG